MNDFSRLLAGLSVVALLASAAAADSLPDDFRVETVATDVKQPVSIAIATDGRVFVSERVTGRVRVIADGKLLPEPFASLPVCATGERGLLGIALDPAFAENGYVYVFHTRTPELQRITRFTDRDNVGLEATVILDGIPASSYHNGGGLAFGPDGMLFFSVGDTGDAEAAGSFRRFAGKIHRIRPDGTTPDDNPWSRRTSFCLGCRNVFDFTFFPGEVPVVIYASENGPTVDDEIHRVTAGDHCGWPRVTGVAGDGNTVDPIHSWRPTTAPVGIAYYRGNQFPREYREDLYVGEFTTGRIVRFELSPDGTEVTHREVFLDGGYGSIYDVELGPDGALWFSTTRGIFRIVGSTPPVEFIRGDIDGADGVDLHDAVTLLAHLLSGAPAPGCMAAADVNADDTVDISDVSTLLGYIFRVVPVLPAPFPHCGVDPSGVLDCREHPACN